ncbi:hypothetical protein M406DRAFT_63249 [Cryphonectria parasitica EP155]|uniref:DNA polymerase lambda n=1 Tax=Cryphonectria parasitica (strain ATCC 38755 / EP155) TaxID=660469 RepID=A0A9P4XWX8_CRYP1|nr:uncharacterized protein M406DRAFT_63249 [Cryphonectria parasitica EP155]KAF3762312.1 hypothetical protein M406DRAFT_63249 [Cryphonectria parasitica EP155]
MSLEMPLKTKEAFYKQLDALDTSFDDEHENLQDDHRQRSRAFLEKAKPGRQHTKPSQGKVATASAAGRVSIPDPKPTKSVSMTAATPNTTIQATPFVPDSHPPASRQQIPSSTSIVQDTPLQEPGLDCRMTKHTSAGTVSKETQRDKGKNDVPEAKRILKNLRLFYIPPDRISLRKHRIEHAEKYGATVTDQLADATHIVVDKNLGYEDIKATVSTVSGSVGSTLVTEEWPLDCIQQGRVLPPYLKYRVKGTPSGQSGSTGKETEQRDATRRPDSSLELKTPHKNPKSLGIPTQQAQLGLRVLSQIINEAREEFKDVPRIGDEDANLNPSEDGGEDDSGAEKERERKRFKKKGGGKSIPKKYDEYYACNRGGTKEQAENKDNPNAFTISVFRKMLDYYTNTNDHWRVLAYRRIITTLSMVKDRTITTAEEAKKLPFFGERLSAKLEEIVKTQTLQRLQFALNDPISQVKALFLGVYGAGPTTADKWIAQGFRTLDDLLRSADLSYSQRIGIEHYEDINSRIPRAEVTKLGEYVKAEAVNIDKEVELLIGGSYRRGATSSGDIDFIITKKGTTSSRDLTPFLDKLVGNLSRRGFLTAELAAHSSTREGSGSKWHGCCVLPRATDDKDNDNYRPVWRRIDLLLVPETEYGAALIYFTGNDIFNRSIRLLASKKKMRLNQRGLYKDVLRDQNRQKISDGDLLEGRDEKRIFQLLGVKWREPHERWC